MVAQKYRWDFIGLSTDSKPTASTSPKVTDGSTYYCSDNSKLYVWYNDRWYERKALGGGGGGGPTVVQTTGTSQTDVMSQKAVTSMVFADPATQEKIKIGAGTSTRVGSDGIEIGYLASATGEHGVAIGRNAQANDYIGATALGINSVANGQGSIALGAASGGNATTQGVMYINATNTLYGYNNSNYRLLTGLYDGQGAHDAMTVGQANALIDAINTALSTNIPHIGA